MYLSIWGNPSVKWDWTTTESYLNIVKNKSWNNIETLIGYSTLRYNISGLSSQPYDNNLLGKMEKLICTELEAGAKGISIGIGYPPNIYAQKNEYELITKLLKKYDKILAVHMRDECNRVIQAFKEIIKYNGKAKCKLQFSHLKTYGKRNWHKNSKLLKMIDDCNKKFDITFDSYPYTAGSTTLNSLLPPTILNQKQTDLFKTLKDKNTHKYILECIENGLNDWENYPKVVGFKNIVPTGLKSRKYKKFEGSSLFEISEKNDTDIIETLCDIILKEKGKASMIMHAMNEENVIEMYKHPKQMVGSDGLYSTKPHPRTYGTFPRVIHRFCNELKALDFVEALYKMTKFPAERFNIEKRGEIKPGYFADLVIFSKDEIKDTATYFEPFNRPKGIKYVILNGKVCKL